MPHTQFTPKFPLSCQDIPVLHDIGYGPLHPIVPPGASLTDGSKLTPDKLGKIPGQRNADGKWYGFDWANPERDLRDLRKWSKYGAGVGFLCGHGLIAVDIDVTDLLASDIARWAIEESLGVAPVRVGNYPKCLMLYRTAPETAAVTGRRFHFQGPGGPDDKHLIEVLGVGQQFAAGGVHPKTGKPYLWTEDLTDARTWDRIPVVDPFDLEVALQFAIEALEGFDYMLTEHTRASTGSREGNVEQTDLLAGDGEDRALVVRAVQALPNDYDDRDSYIRVGCAIKAAFADDEGLGLSLFQEWASKWEGGNDPDVVDADWKRMKPPFAVGARYLLDLAAGALAEAGEVEAAEDLSAGRAAREFSFTPLPPLAEGEFDPSSDEAKKLRRLREQESQEKDRRARPRTDGGPSSRGPAPADLFDRYAYVESIERFVDLMSDTREGLTKSQFKDRHANIGDPTTRDNAASRYLADMVRRRVCVRTTYRPGEALLIEEAGVSALNLWQPGAFFKGKWSNVHVTDEDIAPYLELAEHVFPDADERNTLLDWLAFQLQSPGVKCNWHPVMGSRQHGVGKDTLLEPLVRGLGDANCPVISAADLQGNWTDWLQMASLVRVEEMNTFGRREVMDSLKPLLAAPPTELRVNIKGIPQFKTPNIVNMVIYTNHPDAMAVEQDDRRLFVLWSEAAPWSEDRFCEFYHWLLQEGGAMKVCAWLSRRDLSAFNPKGRAKMTAAKAAMTAAARSPVEAAIAEGIEDQTGIFRRDLVSVGEVSDWLNTTPAAPRGGVSTTRAGMSLQACGARFIGRGVVDGRKVSVYAVRNHDQYREWSVTTQFKRQRDEQADGDLVREFSKPKPDKG